MKAPEKMSLSRRGDDVRARASAGGVEVTVIVSRSGSGPCFFEKGGLAFRYEGTSLTSAQEKLVREVAAGLDGVSFEELASCAPEEIEESPDVAREAGTGDVVTVGQWGGEDVWRTFVMRREFTRNAGSAIRLKGAGIITVSHGESECLYATPRIEARNISLHAYPWVRPLERVTRDMAAAFAPVPRSITTDLRDADVITGGAARLDAVLRDLEAWTGEQDLVIVKSTCVPHVIGDDMEASVASWRGKGSIRFDDVFSPSDRDVLAELLAGAIGRPIGEGAPGGARVSVAGLAGTPAMEELGGILEEAGIEVGCVLVPEVDLRAASSWCASAVQVLVSSPYHDRLNEKVFIPLGMPTVAPPAPWGVARTGAWLEAIARACGRTDRMMETMDHMRERHGPALERLVERAGGHRLGFVVDAGEVESLRDPSQMAGIPVLDMVIELGFGVDVLEYDPCGEVSCVQDGFVSVHGFEDEEGLERLMRELPCEAIYSDLYADGRITRLGKVPFSLQAFEPGIHGAQRTAEKLIGACEMPFYRKYGRHGRKG